MDQGSGENQVSNPPCQAVSVDPIRITSLDHLFLQIGDQLRGKGWALICTEHQGFPLQFTLGLSVTHHHPELEIVGVTPDLGQAMLQNLVERIQAGERLEAGAFFSDLKKGYDFFLVDNPIDPEGPPITGDRLRLIWPDRNHRYPWHPDCDPYCAAQSLMLEWDGLDLKGLERLMAHSPVIS